MSEAHDREEDWEARLFFSLFQENERAEDPSKELASGYDGGKSASALTGSSGSPRPLLCSSHLRLVKK